MSRVTFFASLALFASCSEAFAAAESCQDKIVDVYLSPLKVVMHPKPADGRTRDSEPPIHLRLPREGLRVRTAPGQSQEGTDCSRKEFIGYEAQYFMTSILARGLSLPYDQPNVGNTGVQFNAVDLDNHDVPPFGKTSGDIYAPVTVDDSDDREGFARRSSWVLQPVFPKYPAVWGQFCLDPPEPVGRCYAFSDLGLTYHTGRVIIGSDALSRSTLDTPPNQNWRQIKVSDLDNYLALLRHFADAVVVPLSAPK